MKEKDEKVIIKVDISSYRLLIFISNGAKYKINVSFKCSFNKIISNIYLRLLYGICHILCHRVDSSYIFGTLYSYNKENISCLF